jgi:Fe-S-cluster-containing hydrogenase component 2
VQIIRIHADAPLKPTLGQSCNGCGVCCLAEPCPVGMVISLRRRGACRALRWDDAGRRYRCGLMAGTARSRSPWSRVARRLIAAGVGCDSDAEVG